MKFGPIERMCLILVIGGFVMMMVQGGKGSDAKLHPVNHKSLVDTSHAHENGTRPHE